MSNELFTAFIKWMIENVPEPSEEWLLDRARVAIDGSNSIEQRALKHYITMYTLITQSWDTGK